MTNPVTAVITYLYDMISDMSKHTYAGIKKIVAGNAGQ